MCNKSTDFVAARGISSTVPESAANAYKPTTPNTLPLPGVIIFVHGVNSMGEWFEDSEQGNPPAWRWIWRYVGIMNAYLRYPTVRPFNEFHLQFAQAGVTTRLKMPSILSSRIHPQKIRTR